MKKPILEMKGISKEFPGVKALDNVDLKVFEGEVLALLGENGAGKSTLMKIMSGVYSKNAGEICWRGNPLSMKDTKHAQEIGIAIIHQELNLIPHLSIAENIFIGREPVTRFGNIDWKKMNENANRLLKKLNIDKDPRDLLGSLSMGQRQMVEIAKALSLNASVIIMDEPTDALTDKETESLFRVINELKSENKAIIYISHRLGEIFEICDRVSVLRDGKYVGEESVSHMDEDGLIEMMVGRKLSEQFPRVEVEKGETVLRINGLKNKYVKDISLEVRKGEIVGISGLMGAGRTELGKTIFGYIKHEHGDIYVNGEKVSIKSPSDALRHGIAYVSEDRKNEGLVLGLSVRDNMSLSSLDGLKGALLNIDKKIEEEIVSDYVKRLNIKTPGIKQKVKNLSGGNQQKVSIAKCLMTKPSILILDEPTRGVDVGAKKEIYELINLFKKDGMSIIMISSEMPEIMGMSDRIIVLHDGKITGEFSRDKATQDGIMRCAVGIEEEH
ncbi:ribose transport system ATP-binding protein [Peptoclostridium litorale DSM 5388]|uniref:Ribose import ATP-binding protein RbsA n=1 Tax=Peptoclostridium litorale DSM 5388 TaxID=1121324 RepID=A0A069RDN7_PEPLI|nr:ribose ABC transporter ATP-binding protein RbsA [Peptoclostridium litorale]KDR95126.1 ribose import ATP-binding protein RbsA [Peptoclostridium litorale DSM 5388]SIN74595.1 ribose transport system ATP-binding protein [Peptoclostridium litorale DSM 5388]